MIPFILTVIGGYFIGDSMKDSNYADGGSIEEGNNRMLQSNIKEVKHHSEELDKIVTPETEVEAWVVAKAERSASDLSDITHYLDSNK